MDYYKKLDSENFEEYLQELEFNTVEILKDRASMYIRNDDTLHNFNEAGRLNKSTREEALNGMRLKHIVSVNDIREDLKIGKLPTKELLLEKFTDTINYYILEYISIRDRIEDNENK